MKTWQDKQLMRKCVNAHDRCAECGGTCPYCEPVVPLRHVDGTFAGAWETTWEELHKINLGSE